MNQKFLSWAALGFSLLAVVLVLVGGNQSGIFGATGTRFPNGLSADTTSPVAGELRGTDLTITDDATISGGVLNVPTAANATSTVTVGCVEAYATSSATKIRYVYNTSATTTTINGASIVGGVFWAYGSCQ